MIASESEEYIIHEICTCDNEYESDRKDDTDVKVYDSDDVSKLIRLNESDGY